ncbi:transmembrane protein, putative [Medicago truncatula]|uniref:Transmembrane protein, putative n=1 Tax=Medicago truncatula TaxID=3880 RepID=A0A072TE42_MEDTR|nr:transmembrane protein, putative [Medicago truncatula]
MAVKYPSIIHIFFVFAAALVHTVHTIWLARNAIRFSSANVSIHTSMAKISSLVALSGANSKGNCLVTDGAVLNNFMIPPSYRRVKEIISVIWKPQPLLGLRRTLTVLFLIFILHVALLQ